MEETIFFFKKNLKNDFLTKFFIVGIFIILIALIFNKPLFPFSIYILFFALLLVIPKFFSEKYIIILLLLFALFSNVSAVLGKIIKPMMLLLLIMLIFEFLYNKNSILHWSSIHYFIFGYLIIVSISIFFTIDFNRLKIDLYDLFKALVFFYLISETSIVLCKQYSYRIFSVIINVLILSGVVGALISLYFVISNPNLMKFIIASGGYIRTQGWMDDPNYFALLLNTTIVLAYFFLINENKKFYKILYIFAIILMIVGIVLSMSRGGLIGLFILTIIAVFRERKRKYFWVFVVIILFLFVSLYGEYILRRLETLQNLGSSRDQSIYIRSTLISVGIKDILKSPLLGIGFGDYPESVSHYYSHHSVVHFIAHNIWLQLAGETGIIGLIMYLGIIFSSLILINRAINDIRDRQDNALLKYLNAIKYAQLAYFIPASFLSVHLHFSIWVYFGLTVSILWSVYNGGIYGPDKRN